MSPTWLGNHFNSTKYLLSEETHLLYLESLKKDRYGIAAVGNPARKLIPANYMALQDEAKEMCGRLEEQLGQSAKRSP